VVRTSAASIAFVSLGWARKNATAARNQAGMLLCVT